MLSLVRRVSFAAKSSFLLVLLGAINAGAQEAPTDPAEMARKIDNLTALVEKLQSRVETLESKLQTSGRLEVASLPAAAPAPGPALTAVATLPVAPISAQPAPAHDTTAAPASTLTNLLGGTTVSIGFDGYYGYNFNDPIGRVNLLRTYDVTSNGFAMNQASVIFENAPDVANGKRWGMRLDLQYGQATETLQGNAANELRPDVYRNVFQAYGTYVIPIGSGLTFDFGKWASSLGMEGNYTKDQINYSRSYLFDYLPYYHMGARLSYKFNDKVTANYWLVNGAEATEPNNDYKDELFGAVVTPTKNISWTMNYYLGQEHPNVTYLPNDTGQGLPEIQGTPFLPIENPPTGKLDIFDSYANWSATPKLTLAAEGDYVIERLYTNSAPSHVWGGAWYARYQMSPRWAVAGRFEYLSDRGGLFVGGYNPAFIGSAMALKEGTLTLEQKLGEGFLWRAEWRHDWSNQPIFYTDTVGVLNKSQTTATLGLVWWFGGKQGAW